MFAEAKPRCHGSKAGRGSAPRDPGRAEVVFQGLRRQAGLLKSAAAWPRLFQLPVVPHFCRPKALLRPTVPTSFCTKIEISRMDQTASRSSCQGAVSCCSLYAVPKGLPPAMQGNRSRKAQWVGPPCDSAIKASKARKGVIRSRCVRVIQPTNSNCDCPDRPCAPGGMNVD